MRRVISLILGLSAALVLSAQAETTSEDPVAEAPVERGFAWTPEDGDVIRFNVLRKGNRFGTHTIRFSGDAAAELKVRSEVALKAGLGPITVFRYALDTTETWMEGVLVGLSGSGNNDGQKMSVSARQVGPNLRVSGSAFSGAVPLGIVPSSHWNMAQVQAPEMVSTEDGEIIAMRSQKVGRERVVVAGQAIAADRYLLDAAIDLDLWYDDQARLVKLAFETQGQSIVYELQKLY